MNDTETPDDDIDTARIAEILGVTREHVTDRLTKRVDFPKPTRNATRRLRRWSERQVRAWMRGEKVAA